MSLKMSSFKGHS